MTERKWTSGTRVKRFSSYNAMMLAESGNEVPTPAGDWVKYGDYKAAADIIADLYEALEEATKWIKWHREHPNTINNNSYLFDNKANAALTKARGESE